MAEKKTAKAKAEVKEVKEVIRMARIIKPLVNVRKAPDGEIKFVAKKQEAYKAIAVEGGWVKTEKGYIRADLVKVEEA